jgi:hypothetical protein
MSLKNSLFAASAAALMAGGAYAADSLTIAIVNNGHMINMQKSCRSLHSGNRCCIELGCSRRRRSS